MRQLTPAGIIDTNKKKKYTVEVVQSSEAPKGSKYIWIDLNNIIRSVNNNEWYDSSGDYIIEFDENLSPKFYIKELNAENIFKREKPTSTAYLFQNAAYNIIGLNNLDTSNVTNMESMFNRSKSITAFNLNKWDVSKVTNMSYMFGGCTDITSLDISNWDASNCTDISYMFYNCKIQELKLEGCDFKNASNMNLFISSSDIGSVVEMTNPPQVPTTVYGLCYQSTIPKVIIKGIKLRGLGGTYGNVPCNKNAVTEYDFSDWDVTDETSFLSWFDNQRAAKKLNISNWDFRNGTRFNYFINNSNTNLGDLEIVGPIYNYGGKSTGTVLLRGLKTTREGIMVFINGLVDNSEDGQTHTLGLHGTTKSRLTAEDIAVATGKGWTIA